MSELDLRGLNYKVGGFQQQVLEALSRGSKTSANLLQALDHPLARLLSVSDLVTDCLSVLAVENLITLDDGVWSIKFSGLNMLNSLMPESEKPKSFTVAAKRGYTPPSSHYQGLELRVSTPRRGAYDFLALLSRYGDTFVAHPTAHLAKEQASCYPQTTPQ